jgi:hypothetical protein
MSNITHVYSQSQISKNRRRRDAPEGIPTSGRLWIKLQLPTPSKLGAQSCLFEAGLWMLSGLSSNLFVIETGPKRGRPPGDHRDALLAKKKKSGASKKSGTC